jgi:polyhydroxyalkanoate synthesis repressor PhaR
LSDATILDYAGATAEQHTKDQATLFGRFEMGELRVIKKYPNRRLYDTGRSCYITLEDVHALVVARVPFQVIDQRNKADLTRSILLQVVATLEERHPSLLSQNFLLELIARYGTANSREFASTLERALPVQR